MSKNKGKGKSLERRVQDRQRRGQPASSPGTVYRAPPRVPTMQEQQEAEKLRIRHAGDWQNNPNFDREQGGWTGEEPMDDYSSGRISPPTGDLLRILPLKGAASLLINAPNIIRSAKNWYNKGRTPAEDKMSWRDLLIDDWKQRGKPGDGTKGGWDPTRGFRPWVPASKGGPGSGPSPLIRQIPKRAVKAIMKLRKGFTGYE